MDSVSGNKVEIVKQSITNKWAKFVDVKGTRDDVKSNTYIKKEKMDELIAKGEAEEFDWHKHEAIKD